MLGCVCVFVALHVVAAAAPAAVLCVFSAACEPWCTHALVQHCVHNLPVADAQKVAERERTRIAPVKRVGERERE